jgi:hypothetical protein
MSLAIAAILTGCATSAPDGVVNKVLTDFGLKEPSEEFNAGSQAVFKSLGGVAAAEMKRLNATEQHGAVKFQRDGELHGKYYKEVKVYEAYYPTDVRPISGSSTTSGYTGYIDYQYRMFQSMRKDTAAAAEAESADISTETTGRETYKYTFGPGGAWDGTKGEKSTKK